MRPFRVLSIDGGGIRGLYTAVLLHGLAQRNARMNDQPTDRLDLGHAFDMVVGTSTGAILATAIASGVALEDVIQLYRGRSSAIFSDPTPPPQERLRLLRWLWRHKCRAASTPQALQDALQDVLGGETVGEMYQRRGVALCVPTIDVESQKSWVYKTPHDKDGRRLQRDNDYRLVDVCMSSAAAPIVFPLHGVAKPNDVGENINWFVDGGLWANNPVMVAMIEALSFAPPDAPIELISVSTCPPFKAASVNRARANRGLVGWKGGIGMLEVAIDSQSWAYDYMAKTLATQLGKRVEYLRLTDPVISADESDELRLDNPSEDCLAALVKLGHRAVDLNISEATTNGAPKALLARAFANLPSLPQAVG